MSSRHTSTARIATALRGLGRRPSAARGRGARSAAPGNFSTK